MRERVGIPEEPWAQAAWLAMAEAKAQLTPSQRVEFATYLLASAIESEELAHAEGAEELGALLFASQVLSGAGW